MHNYRLTHHGSFYYLEKRITVLWIFKIWNPIKSSSSLDEIEKDIEKLTRHMIRKQEKGKKYEGLESGYKSLKNTFRLFFEGWDDAMDNFGSGLGMDPVVDIPISKLGITDIQFNETEEHTSMTITLERPGLLIGRAGQTIDAVTAYLSENHDRPVKVLIIESRLWR